MLFLTPNQQFQSAEGRRTEGRTWKVLENEFGSEKSWNLLGSDADDGHSDADADTKMCVSAHLFRIVHPGIAAIVYSAFGQACSIVVRGLRRYSTFSSAKVTAVCLYI